MARDDDRRTEILTQAAELFARKGVASTTVREIGDAAGILSGSLYHHFKSKDAMVDEIVHNYLRDLTGRYEAALATEVEPADRLRALIRASFISLAKHPAACEIYQNDHRYLRSVPGLSDLDKYVGAIQGAWIDVIREGQKTGAFRADLDPTVCYRFLRDAIWPSVRWYRVGRRYKIETITDECIALFTSGLEVQRSNGATAKRAKKVATKR